MKTFKAFVLEAKVPKSIENIDGGDMTREYKTPKAIAKVMGYWSGDASGDNTDIDPIEDVIKRTGAQQINPEREEEDITPNMKAEREYSSAVMGTLESDVENERKHPNAWAHSNKQIADIFNKRGYRTERGTRYDMKTVDFHARAAMVKLKKLLDSGELDPDT